MCETIEDVVEERRCVVEGRWYVVVEKKSCRKLKEVEEGGEYLRSCGGIDEAERGVEEVWGRRWWRRRSVVNVERAIEMN